MIKVIIMEAVYMGFYTEAGKSGVEGGWGGMGGTGAIYNPQ
jgi:hypothetical protein